jgi:hypothetical protein
LKESWKERKLGEKHVNNSSKPHMYKYHHLKKCLKGMDSPLTGKQFATGNRRNLTMITKCCKMWTLEPVRACGSRSAACLWDSPCSLFPLVAAGAPAWSWTTDCWFIHLLRDIWSVSSSEQLWIKVFWLFLHRTCVHHVSLLSVKYWREVQDR